jgi:hypothetical protein
MTTTITSPPYWSIGTKTINRWWLQRRGEEVSGKGRRGGATVEEVVRWPEEHAPQGGGGVRTA